MARLIPFSRARVSAVSPMFNPLTGSVRPSFNAIRGSKSEGRNFPNAASFFKSVFAPPNAPYFFAALCLKSSGTWGHVLRATDDKDRAVPGGHSFVGRRDRLKAGCTITMDRHGGDRFRNARAQRNNAGDIGRFHRLADAAEDDLVDQLRIESGAGLATRSRQSGPVRPRESRQRWCSTCRRACGRRQR